VTEEETTYPVCICTNCYYRVEETISFLKKIMNGQRMLADVLNKSNEKVKLVYGPDTEMRSAARRVGRPRKDSTKLNQEKENCPTIAPVPESRAELREKRIRKPPQRYNGDIYVDPFAITTNQPEENSDAKEEAMGQMHFRILTEKKPMVR